MRNIRPLLLGYLSEIFSRSIRFDDYNAEPCCSLSRFQGWPSAWQCRTKTFPRFSKAQIRIPAGYMRGRGAAYSRSHQCQFVKIAFRNEISDQEVCQVVHSARADYCGLCVALVQCIAVLIDDNFGRLPSRTRSRTRKSTPGHPQPKCGLLRIMCGPGAAYTIAASRSHR